jgi:hypothetical protein
LIKLIPISQQITYLTSTIYDNVKDTSILSEKVIKKHKKWLEKKKDKMNKFQADFISLFGHLQGMDDEFKEVEEKILAPARVKLANAKSMTNVFARDKYIKS